MTIFQGLAGILLLLALGFVLPPLLRARPAGRIGSDVLNTAVARERLAELEQDRDAGRLDAEQYQAARLDLERELLLDLSGTDTSRSERSGRWAMPVLAVLLPLCAVLLYRTLGTEQIIERLQQAPAARQAATEPGRHSLEEMVAVLAARLEQEPDNLEGWTMLARSYTVMGRYGQAVPVYRNILALGGGNDAGLLADFADALTVSSDGDFSDEAGSLLKRALELDPHNVKALWLAGHWKKQTGDAATAIEYWQRAAQRMQPGSRDQQLINQQITQLRQAAGLPETTATPVAAAGGTTLQVSVRLDAALQQQAAADDTVFIYARAASGPPMPLAIQRRQVRELPLTVTLDDSMAMVPGMNLSAFGELTVGARISKSGAAIAQSGDLQGLQSPVKPADTAAVEIVIDSIVP